MVRNSEEFTFDMIIKMSQIQKITYNSEIT